MNTVTRTPLHKHAVDCNKTERRNGETPAYAALQVNHEPRPIKADESAVSPMSKTNSIHDKDASTASRKTDNFYLIHHQSSLIPIKDLLDQKRNSNIEIIQMDEQECILEIVDGVVTLVPKHKSTHVAPVNGDKARSDDKQDRSVEYETSNHYDSPERLERSSSASSSISTPPLELEPEWEDKLSEASGSNREEDDDEVDPEPFILQRDTHSKSPVATSQDENLFDLLDVFSTPLVPTSTSHTETNNNNNNNKPTKNLMDDSLSSVSSYEPEDPVKSSHSEPSEKGKEPSPVQPLSKSSSASSVSAKDESSPASPSNQSSEPLESAPIANTASSEVDYPLPKAEPPPAAKPIDKARINEFASLLSASVHLAQPPPAIKKSDAPKTTPTASRPPPSPSRSDEQSFSSIRSGATSERDDRESFHTVKSPSHSEEPQIKRPIDARYTEKIDDRTSIRINTSNIKALFEQKISDTNRILSQSNEQLLHTSENKQQASHKKVPVSYGSLKRNLPLNLLPTNPAPVRRQSYQDTPNMSKYTDHIAGTKDMVIEDKKPEQTHPAAVYSNSIRRHNTEEIIRPAVGSSRASPDSAANGSRSESLIAREIRETREKEEELRRQRRSCGLPEDASSLFSLANNDPLKPEAASSSSSSSTSTPGKAPVKSSSFLSNLDFFVSKENTLSASATPSRRSTTSIHNLVYDTNPNSSPDDFKPVSNVVAQELSRFSNSGIPIVRTSSASNYVQRSSSNQNVLAASNTSNVIQREIEAIRAKEAELRQLGRIQHTSDEHSDPRKYQEQVPTLPKSQSINALATGRVKRDTDRTQRPLLATANGFLQPKSPSSSATISSVRGKFPSPNPLAPVIRSSNESTDYSKLSSADRLELEKREVQEREQELKKQRHSLVGGGSSVNGDSGNASQDEHDDDQERYSDKIARLKRKENEKAQAPLVRPTRKLDMSQRWEQMLTNKTAEQFVGDVQDDDPFDE